MAMSQCCGQWTLLAGCLELILSCMLPVVLRTSACLIGMQQERAATGHSLTAPLCRQCMAGKRQQHSLAAAAFWLCGDMAACSRHESSGQAPKKCHDIFH